MAHAKINLQRMYDWLQQLLGAGEPTPDDAAIVDRFGFASTESARTLLAELADAGRITIKGHGADRAITLGRRPSAASIATRPQPSVRSRANDDALDAGVAKIAAIAARSRTATPPPSPPVPVPSAPPQPEISRSIDMVDTVNISVHVRGEATAAIRAIAASEETSLGRVAARLIEMGLAARDRSTSEIRSGSITVEQLQAAPVEMLTDEIVRRAILVDQATSLSDAAFGQRDAALARAESAEGQLATVRAQLRLLGEA